MKQITMIILASVLTFGCQKADKGYNIEGSIEGMTGKVYLTYYEGKQPVHLDSIETTDGKFSFKGNVPLPVMASIDNSEGALIRFFLENSAITANGKIDDKDAITVAGSKTNDEYKWFTGQQDSIYAIHTDTTTTDEMRTSLEQELDNISATFIDNHRKSIAGLYVYMREKTHNASFEELYSEMDKFDPLLRESTYAKVILKMADARKNTAVGQPFEDLAVADSTGNVLKLSDYVAKKQYILLDFWASWCGPCRAESPFLVSAYAKFHDKGFEIYAVSLDKDRENWIKGINNMNLNWIHVSTLKFWNSEAAETYGVRSIPANILISPDGIIIARNLHGAALEAKLAELIK